MPPLKRFRCQYSVQFVAVVGAYGLTLDKPSVRALAAALQDC